MYTQSPPFYFPPLSLLSSLLPFSFCSVLYLTCAGFRVHIRVHNFFLIALTARANLEKMCRIFHIGALKAVILIAGIFVVFFVVGFLCANPVLVPCRVDHLGCTHIKCFEKRRPSYST